MNLILKNVNKTYGKKTVLNDINMQTDEGEIIGLIEIKWCRKNNAYESYMRAYRYNLRHSNPI